VSRAILLFLFTPAKLVRVPQNKAKWHQCDKYRQIISLTVSRLF